MTILTRQSETGPVGQPNKFARQSRHANRGNSRSRICTNRDHRYETSPSSVDSLIGGPEHVNFNITGIFARKMRQQTGRIFELQKAYPTYFDPSESNGEDNFIKQQPQHVQFHQ